jgi:hypothetical protein
MFHTISSPTYPSKPHPTVKECARRTPFKALWLILSCAVLGSFGNMPVIGQGAPGAVSTAAPSPHAVTAATPQRIAEHEGNGCIGSGTDYSTIWTFDGLKGRGKFPGTEQQMDIDSFDGHTLVLRRTWYSSGQIGSGQIDGTGVYTGQVNGTHISGTVVFHPTKGNAGEAPWCGEIEDPRVFVPETLAAQQQLKTVPPQILECEKNEDCDGLWNFSGSSGKAVWPRNVTYLADLTVESFSPDKIVIRRNDTAPKPLSVVYTGKLDGNRISGTAAAHEGQYNWPYNWTAIIPATSCVRTDGLKLDTQEAVDVGNIALRFNLRTEGLDCYLIAAKNGDADAQDMVAALYYEGGNSPIKQDYSLAFYWASKSAAQENYGGERFLGIMYERGIGTEVDHLKAQYWSARAAATPEGIAVAQAKAQQAQDKAREEQLERMYGIFFSILSGVLDGGSSSSRDNQIPTAGERCRNYQNMNGTSYNNAYCGK